MNTWAQKGLFLPVYMNDASGFRRSRLKFSLRADDGILLIVNRTLSEDILVFVYTLSDRDTQPSSHRRETRYYVGCLETLILDEEFTTQSVYPDNMGSMILP